MLKFFSGLLSFVLIITSVTPTLAGVPVRPRLPSNGLVTPRTTTGSLGGRQVSSRQLEALNYDALLKNMRLTPGLTHAKLLSNTSQVPATRQMLDYPDAAKRAKMLRSDFQVYVWEKKTHLPERTEALEFYRGQLAKEQAQLAQITARSVTTNVKHADLVAATIADISSLGLFGEAAQDAPRILETFQKTVGTDAEAFVTAVSARALLSLGAYEQLEVMSALSTKQPELWEGIAYYARQNNLPVRLADKTRTAADITSLKLAMKELGDINALALNNSVEATVQYMNGGRTVQEEPARVTLPEKTGVAVTAKPAAEKPTAQAKPATSAANNGALYSSILPIPSAISHRLQARMAAGDGTEQAGAGTATQVQVPQAEQNVAEQDLHLFRDQGLTSEGMQATFPVYWEDKTTGITLDVDFQFENQAAKGAFYNRVDLQPDEFFVFDRGTGGIVIRKEMTAEQRASGAKPKQRGFFKVFFEGGQKTPFALYKVLFSREMVQAFEAAPNMHEVKNLLLTYRADLKQILSKELQAKYPALEKYLKAKDSVLDKATIELLETGEVMKIAKDIAAELNGILATTAGTPIKVYKDDIGHWAQNFAGFAEGTFGTMGQANTSALGLLGISKGFLSNLPTSLGQFGPAWAPFIGAWAEKYGTKKMLNIGQLLGTGGHLAAAGSLAAGALGVLPPLEAFAGMVGGITVNGVAGSILKQINPMIAKQRTSDPVSSSATITDLNSWASVGGMYCYLFLPTVGALSWLLSGSMDTTLWALAGMFGVASTIPLTANLLLRKSRIENVVKNDAAKTGVFKTIGNNLKFGWKSPFIRTMAFATAGGHFMGLGFNSGPGHFIKENISNPSVAMLVSFLSVYLTVFAGRKLGAKAMQKGFIGDKALAGLSGLVGVTMGAASLIPGLDFATRCALFAAAGLGFSNWVNVLQSIELSRPENVGKEAAVSSMYILARTSGMLTMLMGAFGDSLGAMMGLSPSTAALYALTMPLAAGLGSMLLNRHYITQDLWPTAKRWGLSLKDWFKNKLGVNKNAPVQNQEPVQEAPAQ